MQCKEKRAQRKQFGFLNLDGRRENRDCATKKNFEQKMDKSFYWITAVQLLSSSTIHITPKPGINISLTWVYMWVM